MPRKGGGLAVVQPIAVDLIKVVPEVRAHLVQGRAGQAGWRPLGGALGPSHALASACIAQALIKQAAEANLHPGGVQLQQAWLLGQRLCTGSSLAEQSFVVQATKAMHAQRSQLLGESVLAVFYWTPADAALTSDQVKFKAPESCLRTCSCSYGALQASTG